ncbi:TetR/AcrR family transcriptional regulator [Spirillospora sp. NPDC047279]|uniref:TetR/AcrR family transcriptional regulator n=1 Tax=Spirillospora sp. NPDC047279 TaxID=3155478 RepID=UPI0033EDCB13
MPAAEKPIPSVWTRPRKQREQPALSRERIVAEAVALLDAEGIDNLSMRTLGNRLNAGATSLYRHVANKDELIELVVDEVYGELEVPAAGPDGWRDAAAQIAASTREMALRHPWVVMLLGQAGLAYLGPNMMRQTERILAVFQEAGFDAAEADQAMTTMLAYVIGLVTSEAAYLSLLARSGRSEQEWADTLRPAVEAATKDYDRLTESYAAIRDKDPARMRQETFDYGLARVLDGIEVRLTGPASTAPTDPAP